MLQSHSILCDPTDYSPPDSSAHGIFQAKILEWVAISSSRGSSWPRDWTSVSCLGRHILYHCTTWEALYPLDVCNPHHLYHPTKNISSKCPLEAKIALTWSKEWSKELQLMFLIYWQGKKKSIQTLASFLDFRFPSFECLESRQQWYRENDTRWTRLQQGFWGDCMENRND